MASKKKNDKIVNENLADKLIKKKELGNACDLDSVKASNNNYQILVNAL